MTVAHDDDRLARQLLTVASAFTGEVLSLAAEVAGCVLDAVSAWPALGGG